MSTLKEKHKTLYDMLKLSEDTDNESTSAKSDIASNTSELITHKSLSDYFNTDDSSFTSSSDVSSKTQSMSSKHSNNKNSKTNSQNDKKSSTSVFSSNRTEFETVNVQFNNKKDLLSFDDEEVQKLIKEYDFDLCIMSAMKLKDRNFNNELNIKRCKCFHTELQTIDYLYMPVYLSHANTDKILDVIFLIFNIPRKEIEHGRLVKECDIHYEMIVFAKEYSILNMIYKKNNDYLLKRDDELYCMKYKDLKHAIKYLCAVNKNFIDENTELYVNPKCSSKEEFKVRFNVYNEVCLQSSKS